MKSSQILAMIFFLLFLGEAVLLEMEYQVANRAQRNFSELLEKSEQALKACK